MNAKQQIKYVLGPTTSSQGFCPCLSDMPLSLHCLVAHQKGPSHSPVSHEKSQVKSTFLGKSFEMRIFRKDLSALSSVGKFLQPAVPFTKVQQCLLSLPADIEIPLLHSWHHLSFFFFFSFSSETSLISLPPLTKTSKPGKKLLGKKKKPP